MPIVVWTLVMALLSLTAAPLRAQDSGLDALAAQQQALQGLLNNALVAVRANDLATACQLRGQALTILNANFGAFTAAYPANNWSDLQRSLQGSLKRCPAAGP